MAGKRSIHSASDNARRHLLLSEAIKPEQKGLVFSLWAHYMGIFSSVYILVEGLVSFYVIQSPTFDYISIYLVGCGLVLGVFEGIFRGRSASDFDSRYCISTKGLIYIIMSVPLLASPMLTLLSGIIMLMVGSLDMYAVRGLKETGEITSDTQFFKCIRLRKPARPAVRCCSCKRMVEEGTLATVVVLVVYSLVSLCLGVEAFLRWRGIVASIADDPPSQATPWAKAAGQLLNFNCSLVVVPVIKLVVDWLNRSEVRSATVSGQAGKWVSRHVPWEQNILLHKFVACNIAFFSLVHTAVHVANYRINWTPVIRLFGYQAWISGYVVMLAMLVIFSGSHSAIRRAKRHLFWVTHHCFLIAWGALLVHGPVFWRWSCVPLALYALERLYMAYSPKRDMQIVHVAWLEPVLEVRFIPKDKTRLFSFKAGQYVMVNIPAINREDWHPFTISSAPGDFRNGDGYISVHMNIGKQGSWTYAVRRYLGATIPQNMNAVQLYNSQTEERVSTMSPDRSMVYMSAHSSLMRVNGPFSAPSQHHELYRTVLLACLGIGVTPMISALREVICYTWSPAARPGDAEPSREDPSVVYWAWCVKRDQIYAFRWIVESLVEILALAKEKAVLGQAVPRYLELHIYVTGEAGLAAIEESARPGFPRGEDDEEETGRLYNLISTAAWPAATQGLTMSEALRDSVGAHADSPVTTWLWHGRPHWEQLYQHIASMKPLRVPAESKHIGVCFCGRKEVAEELERCNMKFSSLDKRCIFKGHIENF